VKLAWSPPVDGGIPVAIKVYRAAGSTPPTAAGTPFATVAATVLEFTDSAVSNYDTYTYVVLAANNAGDGPPSNPVAATPMAGLPGAPAGLAATNGDGQVTLAWSAPAGGGAATQYRVYRGQTGSLDDTWSAITTVDVTVSTFQDQDPALVNFTLYGYVVRAVNLTGEGPPSTLALGYPNNGVPGMPLSVAAVPGDQQVHVSWSAPAEGGDTQQYTVYRGTALPFDVETWLAFAPQDAPATTLDDTTVVNWVTYSYGVIASNPIGSSPPSIPGAATPNNGAPGTPQNVAAAAGDSEVTVTWDPPLAGGDVFQYAVSRCELPDCALWSTLGQVAGSAPAREYTDSAVVNFTTYRYRVAASNPIGQSPSSAEAAAMPNNGVPGVPLSLASVAALGSIALTWQAPADGGDVYEYRVYRSLQDSTLVDTSSTPLATVAPGIASYEDTTVLDFHTYAYAVAAWNPVGQGASTAALQEMAGLAPGAPQNVGIASGDARVDLTWQAPGGGGPVTGYRILRDFAPGATTSHAVPTPATGTSFAESGLVNNTAYFYRIVAENLKGDGPASEEVTGFPRLPNAEVPSGNPSHPAPGGQTGRSVAISGNYAVIGSPMQDQSGGPTDAGAAYVYERDALGAWTEVAYLERPAADPEVHAQFGHAVAIDGDVALVGAPKESRIGSTLTFAGRVSVFRRQSGGGWAWEADLNPPANSANAQFGYSVAISGNVALVGANRIGSIACSDGAATPTGTVYPYEYSSGVWTAKTALLPPAAGCAAANYSTMDFGFSVAVSGDLAVIGSPNEKVTGGATRGAAWFYRRESGSGQWQFITTGGKVTPTTQNDQLAGWSVAIAGTWAAVGAPTTDCPVASCPAGALTDAGAVGFYEFNGSSWAQSGTAVFSPTRAAGRRFGQAVDMTATRAVAVSMAVGATPHAMETCTRSGAAWTCASPPLFTAPADGTIILGLTPAYIVGSAVAVDGDNTLIGIPYAKGQSVTESFVGDFTFR
jgi:hypothetical protein